MRKRLHPANKEARALLKRRINMGAFEVPTRDIFTREKTTLVPFWYDWAEPRNVLYITKSTETILYNLLHAGGYDCIKITASADDKAKYRSIIKRGYLFSTTKAKHSYKQMIKPGFGPVRIWRVRAKIVALTYDLNTRIIAKHFSVNNSTLTEWKLRLEILATLGADDPDRLPLNKRMKHMTKKEVNVLKYTILQVARNYSTSYAAARFGTNRGIINRWRKKLRKRQRG